jgi:hypothetical protein
MKKWMHFLIVFLPFSLSAQVIKRTTVETKMEKVTVFLKGAQVKRTGKQIINTGKQEIVFRGISTDIEKNSVQVKVDGSGMVPFEITYLVKKAGWYPTYNVRVKDVVSPLMMEMNANVYQTTGEGWNNIKMVLSTGNPNENNTKPVIAPWILYYVDANLSNFMKQYYLNSDGQTLIGRVEDENGIPLAGASVIVKGTGFVTSTDANGIYNIKSTGVNQLLSVSSVGYESYEFMAPASFANVKLKAAANNLNEVIVTAYNKDLAGSAPGINVNNVRIRGASTLYGSQAPLQVEVTYQPTTTQYEIEEITTVNNDGKMNTISIKENAVDAYYEYYTAPKLEEAAYLTAKLTNWQDLNLIPGETNLFFEGTYLGKSFLDLSDGADTLLLSLGIDKAIVVNRTTLKEYSTKKFLGANRTDSRRFEITVRNNKTVPVNILVEDVFPISPQKEIEVDDMKYEGAKLNDDTKVITWSYTIEPKQQKKLEFKYSVKYPKEKNLKLD